MKKFALLTFLPFIMQMLVAQNYLLQGPTGSITNSNVYQDANGLIGIGTATPAAHLDVVGGNGLSETAIPVIAPHYAGTLSPAPDYIIASRDYFDSPSNPDFNVNPVGQVGIGMANEPAILGASVDLLIQDHGWPSGSGNSNFVIIAMDDNTNGLVGITNTGSSANPAGAIAIGANSNITDAAALAIFDNAGNLGHAILAVSGTGAIGMGTSSLIAQLDINNATYPSLDYLFHIGDAGMSKDYLTVGNTSDVEVGIGILPTGINTLALQGTSGTTLDLFETSGVGNIRWFDSDGHLRHVMYDDIGLTGNLVIFPGANLFTESGVVSTAEVLGNTQVDYNLSVGGNSAITGNEAVGGNVAVTGTIRIGAEQSGSNLSNAQFTNYQLSVYGQIVAEEVVVQTSSWSDTVFSDTYRIKSLDEVENFIAKNHHLPDVPTETEAVQNGVSLGEMNKLLLQKVEELTIYTIELKKELKQLKSKIK